MSDDNFEREDCGNDVESDGEVSKALEPSVAKRAKSAGIRASPSLLTDIVSVGYLVCSLIETARRHGFGDVLKNLRNFLLQGVLLTSCYSGLGTFECAASWLFVELGKALGIPEQARGKVILYAVTDCGTLQQKVLADMSCKSLRRFKDVLHRLYPNDLVAVQGIEIKYLGRGDLDKSLCDDGLLLHDAMKHRRIRLGEELVSALSDYLQECEFSPVQYCEACKEYCPWMPRSTVEYNGMYWMEAGGSHCQPFSRANHDPGGWLNKATLCTLVWVYSCRFFEPEQLLHECVPGIGCAVVQEIMTSGSTLKSPLVPVPGSNRGNGQEKMSRTYRQRSHTFSPYDIGIPTLRRRAYVCYSVAELHEPVDLSFRQLFHCECEATAEVYLFDDLAAKSITELGNVQYAKVEGYHVECLKRELVDQSLTCWTPSLSLSILQMKLLLVLCIIVVFRPC